MTPEHRKALAVDKKVRALQDGLDLCTTGLTYWCATAAANDTYQRSPSENGVTVRLDIHGEPIPPEEDVNTAVEAAAFHHPDPMVGHAHSYLAAVDKGDWKRAIVHAWAITRHIPEAERPDPCVKCGKTHRTVTVDGRTEKTPVVIKSKKTGWCTGCVSEADREKNRVA